MYQTMFWALQSIRMQRTLQEEISLLLETSLYGSLRRLMPKDLQLMPKAWWNFWDHVWRWIRERLKVCLASWLQSLFRGQGSRSVHESRIRQSWYSCLIQAMPSMQDSNHEMQEIHELDQLYSKWCQCNQRTDHWKSQILWHCSHRNPIVLRKNIKAIPSKSYILKHIWKIAHQVPRNVKGKVEICQRVIVNWCS